MQYVVLDWGVVSIMYIDRPRHLDGRVLNWLPRLDGIPDLNSRFRKAVAGLVKQCSYCGKGDRNGCCQSQLLGDFRRNPGCCCSIAGIITGQAGAV